MEKGKKDILRDTTAISEALGFILIIAIVFSATAIYISQQIPELTKDFEARHAEDVSDDFSELDSLIDGIVLVAKQENATSSAATKSITMSPNRVPFLGMSPPGANLLLSPREGELFAILPYVGNCSPPTDPPINDTIEESTTEDFSYTNDTTKNNATQMHVNVMNDQITLERTGSSGPLILDNEITTLSGDHQYSTVSITNNSIVYLIPGNYLKLFANTIYIDSTSKILGDGCGFEGGDGGENGNGAGMGFCGFGGSGGGGAGYAGIGGDGGLGGYSKINETFNNSGVGGFSYGANTTFEFGSGGAGGAFGSGGPGQSHEGQIGGDGGNGGGVVVLDAASVRIAGTVSAKGTGGDCGLDSDYASGGGGGGSGGTIIIRGYKVNLSSATLSVDGGSGGQGGYGKTATGGGGGGGSGGKIKIFYDPNASLYNTTSLSWSVYRGEGGAQGTGLGNPFEGDPGENGSDGVFDEIPTTYISTVPHVEEGWYISRVYDTGSDTTCYGTITWDATISAYTSLVIKVRTCCELNMTDPVLWENYPAVANGQDISKLSSAFDTHQYIQYYAHLKTYDSTITPVLRSVRINYSSYCPGGGCGVEGAIDSATGDITFRSGYIYYPNQEIAYEHGAVIRAQKSGSQKTGFVVHNPPITIGKDDVTGSPALQISLVNLSGSNYSYSGSKSSSVEMSYNDYTHFAETTTFNNLSLYLTTAYPYIWQKWFNTALEKSGLVKGDDYAVIVDESAGTVVAEFYGHGDGVKVYAEKTTIAVDMKT